QEIAEQGHDGEVTFDKAKFHIQADVFINMPSSFMWLGAEHRTNLKDTLEDADHDLLIKLRALGQISWATKVVETKDVRAAFGGSGNDFWRLYFSEITCPQRSSKGVHNARA